MNAATLLMGPLSVDGYAIQRSGIRWLKESGQYCRPRELVAYCNIGLVPMVGGRRPFSEEARDFQVGFATKLGGRLYHSGDSSLGGHLDYLEYQEWTPELTIGRIEPDTEDMIEDPQLLRLFMFAGRRPTEMAEAKFGLLSGWHDRSRVWSGEGLAPCSTLLSLGICEQLGIIRGARSTFQEFLEDIRGPAHIVYVPDHLLIPSAPILLEQMKRGAAQLEEIAADLARNWHDLRPVPAPDDWMFVGSVLTGMTRKPLGESYDILTRHGVSRTGPADVVLLSLHSESSLFLRHKRLGYGLNCHGYRLSEVGPAVRGWLRSAFEPIRRTPEMIYRDLRDLIQAVRENAPTEFLIMNMMSTSGSEDVITYSTFERPMGDVLKTHSMKEMNLMLHDLARECDVSIVDTDAIATDLGAAEHLTDGVHSSGALQAELRQEIIRLLTARGVAGFAPAAVR